MRKTLFFIALTLLLASLVTGCRHENSVTGPDTGSATLTGQVVGVGDLSGASVAGINVTCNGLVADTDTAGRFTFVGLSSIAGGVSAFSTDRKLSFSRGDGISASASVTPDASSVVVQLQKKQATVVVTGQSKREIEGLIQDVSDSSITVDDASTGGPVTAAITSSTVIRKGNRTLKATDLKHGDRVHVKASVASDGSLTAFEIMLQNSGDDSGGGGQTKELEGTIAAVSDDSITVNNASTGGPVTAAITKDTVIRKGNTKLKASDLHAGDRVHVKTTGSGDSLTATEIMLQNPA